MESSAAYKVLAIMPVLTLFFRLSSSACSFTVHNNCPHTIWPGTLAGAGTPELPTTGFRLDTGQTARIRAGPQWSGRLWARTGCQFDDAGVGTCLTGDCGGRMECRGAGAVPPVTLFEITLGNGIDDDFYDVSLVDGYNLPVVAAPRVLHGACNATGCLADLNTGCPKELQVEGGGGGGGGGGGVVACKSACEAFRLDEYCCSGEFANANTCKPSPYSSIFKAACPRAYSYAFDDGSSTFTCKAYDYTIIFCPDLNRLRSTHNYSTGQPDDQGGKRGSGSGGDEAEEPDENTASNLPSHLFFLPLFFLLF